MIKNTFCHTPGISENTEKILWANGILDWDTFIEKFDEIDCIPKSKLENIKTELFFSIENLNCSNIKYFCEKLNPNLHYRLANLGKIAYVDIETTGLSRWTDQITMIGIYDGKIAKSYIQGQDLEEAYDKLDEFDIIVTFNGKTFDLPFIEQKAKRKYDFLHLDLRYLLKEYDLRGGLKKIEKELQITRDIEVENVDGFEAVRLWRKYKNGDENALKKLLLYNKEDIVNLKYLLDWYLNKKISQLNINNG